MKLAQLRSDEELGGFNFLVPGKALGDCGTSILLYQAYHMIERDSGGVLSEGNLVYRHKRSRI